jgi:hypothetical protein
LYPAELRELEFQMSVKRKLLQYALVVVITTNAFAQQKPTSDAGAVASAERLRSHVTYLASDKLEGRRTGMEGASAAARYIAAEFARYKLRPGGSHPAALAVAPGASRYMQEFPFIAGVTLGRNNSMLFTPNAASASNRVDASNASGIATTGRAASLDLRLGEDWTPLGFSSNASHANAPVVFAGYGIKAAEFNYDDYAGTDVRGRIVLALAGTPDNDNPHGQFARYADVRWKAIAAREKGALALVVIAREENFRDGKLSRLSYDNSGGEAGLPLVVISRQAASRILTAGGLPALADLETTLRAAHNTPSANTAATGGTGETRKSVNVAQPLQNVTLSLATDVVRRSTPGANVVGIIEGSDAQLKNEAVVIGAHYDHLGRGGEGSLAPREGEIHHGADDNASGVAGLLELARIFSSKAMRPRRTLVLIAFGGEEEGLIGSNYYVNHPAMPLGNTIAMINMDMIGRMKENQLTIGGVGTAAEWRELINAANRSSFSLALNEDGYGPSDHSSFYSKQVPVLFFFTGTHADYHKPSDTADKINYDGEAQILSMVYGIIRAVDSSDRRPTYAVAKSEGTRRSMSFRVSLGVVPNYAESNDGMKIDGVRDDSPAAKAGIKAGDRVTKMAGRDVRNVYDYTYALGEMKAGEQYEVEIVRGSEILKLKITPTARK